MTWRARTKELRGIHTPTNAYDLRAPAGKFPWLAAMWLEVNALTSDHLWRRNCDGHSTCVLRQRRCSDRGFFVGTMYWPTALTKPVQIYSQRFCDWIRIQFATHVSGCEFALSSAFVWQAWQEFDTECLVPIEMFSLERFRGVVRQQLLH